MAHLFSLAHLTLLSLSAQQLIDVAAETGYDGVGLRLLPAMPEGVAYPLMNDPAALAETLARCRATGVAVLDLEIVRLNEHFAVADFMPFFEAGAALGARAMLVAGEDRDPARLVQSFGALCEAARPFGLTADIEFMPWHAVCDLAGAVRLIEAAGRPGNAGILFDAMHYSRTRTTLAEVPRVPQNWLHYAQICDAPASIPETTAELIQAARFERLLPGEGGIDLEGLFGALPDDVPISVEIPNAARVAQLGGVEWARQALRASQAFRDAGVPRVQ